MKTAGKKSLAERLNYHSCDIAACTIDFMTWGVLICLYWRWFVMPVFGVPMIPFYVAMAARVLIGGIGQSYVVRFLEKKDGEDGWHIVIKQVLTSLGDIAYVGSFAVAMHLFWG